MSVATPQTCAGAYEDVGFDLRAESVAEPAKTLPLPGDSRTIRAAFRERRCTDESCRRSSAVDRPRPPDMKALAGKAVPPPCCRRAGGGCADAGVRNSIWPVRGRAESIASRRNPCGTACQSRAGKRRKASRSSLVARHHYFCSRRSGISSLNRRLKNTACGVRAGLHRRQAFRRGSGNSRRSSASLCP